MISVKTKKFPYNASFERLSLFLKFIHVDNIHSYNSNLYNMPNYQKSKNDAFHRMISQKISQKIDSLP